MSWVEDLRVSLRSIHVGMILGALGAIGCGASSDRELFIDAPREVFEVTIDSDEGIEADPGEGAGVFLEYQSGGSWELFTTCDTAVSDLLCEFDILLSVPLGYDFEQVVETELESDDYIVQVERGVMQLLWLTDVDFDRISFETEPGQTLRLDVLLDGLEDPEIVFWIGYGALQIAAPSNPLDLTPSEP